MQVSGSSREKEILDAERASEYFTITGNAKEKWEKVWRWGGDLDIKFEVSEGQVGEDARFKVSAKCVPGSEVPAQRSG